MSITNIEFADGTVILQPDNPQPVESSVNTPRWCYHVCEQDPAKYGGYVPSMVIADEGGHRMLVGRGDGSAPWIWGQTLEEAQAVCDKMNQDRIVINPDEASDIV